MREHRSSTALLVTLGGDGTFLYGARLAAPLGIPVVGVNRGRLGFLNDVEIDALPEAISRFASGDYTTQRRALLEIAIDDTDEPVLAINEIVVRARDVNVVRLRVDVDGDLLGAFDADGIVVATATGSTAYALSAGGPPVDPRVRAVIVVPLAAHAVISRPVVIPENLDVRVTVERGRVFVAADGRSVAWLADGRSIVVRPVRSSRWLRFANSPSFNSRTSDRNSATGFRTRTCCSSRSRTTRPTRPAHRGSSVALRELRVSNLAVIEEARLAFDDGFTVLTGETGSGKSMCVNALRAALGGRLEPDAVRSVRQPRASRLCSTIRVRACVRAAPSSGFPTTT